MAYLNVDNERSQAEIRRSLYISAIQSDRSAVCVGPGQKIYHIPQGLLTQHSTVIREMFERPYKQNGEPIDLRDVKVATFEEFLLWLYAFDHYAGWESIDAAIDLAIFADAFGIRQLKNQTSDFLQAAINEHRWKATPEHVHKVYGGVPGGALLRQLCFLAFSIAVGSTEVINRHLHCDRAVDRLPCAAWEPVFSHFPSLGWDYFRHVQAGHKRITNTGSNGACVFHDHDDVRGWVLGSVKICPYPHGTPVSLVPAATGSPVLEMFKEAVEELTTAAAAEACTERAAGDEQSAGSHTLEQAPDSGVVIEELRPRLSTKRQRKPKTKAAAVEGVTVLEDFDVPEQVEVLEELSIPEQIEVKFSAPDEAVAAEAAAYVEFTELEEPPLDPEPVSITERWSSWTSKGAEGTLEESHTVEDGWGEVTELESVPESAIDESLDVWPRHVKKKRRGTLSFEEAPKIDDILLAEPEIAPEPAPEPALDNDMYLARTTFQRNKKVKKSKLRVAESADDASREYGGEEVVYETPPPSGEEQQSDVLSWCNWSQPLATAKVIY